MTTWHATESCSCGATISTSAYTEIRLQAMLLEWRTSHRHHDPLFMRLIDEIPELAPVTDSHLSAPVPFVEAGVGDCAYTYESDDGNLIDEHGWVTNLEYFDERDYEMTLVRKLWRLVEVDELVLPDPYPQDPNEEESTTP